MKTKYRILNWSKYNKSLINRGDVTLWFSEDYLNGWYASEQTGKKGASNLYSDQAIECLLMLKGVYRLPLRAAQGFGRSLMKLVGRSFKVPHYTTLSRRQSRLSVNLMAKPSSCRDIAIDSTGIKIYGEGEWKVRMHGYSKRRCWLKLHLAVDTNTHDIVASVVSDNSVGDSEVINELVDQIDEPLGDVTADGAYDTRSTYDAINKRDGRVIIPPRSGAKIWQHGNKKTDRHQRDENLRAVRKHGKKKWKKDSGYHQRSLSETAMYRMKQLMGRQVSARRFEAQSVELFLRCAAVNRMTGLGMPVSIPVI
jgi:hypothetical protein